MAAVLRPAPVPVPLLLPDITCASLVGPWPQPRRGFPVSWQASLGLGGCGGPWAPSPGPLGVLGLHPHSKGMADLLVTALLLPVSVTF